MKNPNGPMDRIFEGLESESTQNLADLKAEVQSLGIDPDAAIQKLQSQANEFLKQKRTAWRETAYAEKALFDSKLKVRTSWINRSPEEIEAAFLSAANSDLALAFKNRKGTLTLEDKAQILDDADALDENPPTSETP